MPNRWNIPPWLEQEIRARDKHCVYCGVRFEVVDAPRQEQASWEHIVNDARIITRENIALDVTSKFTETRTSSPEMQ
jgi:hypothetical protein